MSNSFRIRTEPGVDKSLNVLIDQEFEYLEILSLKILQSQIYTRQCSDYGVLVGRVSVNNGFGIPNAKVSIFVPLDSTDELDPVISELYPYKSLSDLNDDGYRYNLLPYRQSHSGHVPTGTFFDRKDVLVDPTLIEVYDKYYKFSTVTNTSGDYMIFGLPTGSQTIVVDVDLSDIGEFSLSPQDLIRMGIATPSQVAGVSFKSSTNLRSLPQIITINRTVEVEPLWGQPQICNLGITRTDFDLSSEAGIDIRPTAVFMGSIVSTTDDDAVKRTCKVRGNGGYLCSLTTGPGEILAIRQTIFQDEYGRPVLESVDLDEGGKVIDENGTWLIAVPMNLDYYITNEFGEQVISNDPKKGIPTRGKYRFKVKWDQSPSLSEQIKRGYFIVPNIREHGWNNSNDDPLNDSNRSLNSPYDLAMKSYAFSLDWADYGYTGTSNTTGAQIGRQMIQEAIDCDDKFYIMQYNKVYTVSQLVDKYRKGISPDRFIGIKNILDDSCNSENNKFPTNDSNMRFDIIYILYSFLMMVFRPILYLLLVVAHFLYFVIMLLRILIIPALILYYTVQIINTGILIGGTVPYALGLIVGYLLQIILYALLIAALVIILRELWKMDLKGISLPMLTYPDCDLCDCSVGQTPSTSDTIPEDAQESVSDISGDSSEEFPCPDIYLDPSPDNQLSSTTALLSVSGPIYKIQGNSIEPSIKNAVTSIYSGKIPSGDFDNSAGIPNLQSIVYTVNDRQQTDYIFSSNLILAERINLFNTKAKYFDNSPGSNPGGGVNRIKVTFDPVNNNPLTNFHYDNTIVILCDKNSLNNLTIGQIVSFQNPGLTKDLNLISGNTNSFNNKAITGFTTTGMTSISFNYASPNIAGSPIPVNYNVMLTGSTEFSGTSTGYNDYYKFPIDIEYFQVLTGMTYSEFSGQCGTSIPNSLNERFLSNEMYLQRWYGGSEIQFGCWGGPYTKNGSETFPILKKPINYLKDPDQQCVLILNRGVDPNVPRVKIRYDLNILFGKNLGSDPSLIIEGDYKMNYPIQGKFKNVSHDENNLPNNLATDSYSGEKLYFNTFNFTPNIGASGFTSFTSTLFSYYSRLDNNALNYSPNCPGPPEGLNDPFPVSFEAANSNSTYGLKVVNTNDFTSEWSNGTTTTWGPSFAPTFYSCNIYLPVSNGNGSNLNTNRGYYVGEIVEGGSLAYMRFSVSVPPNSSYYWDGVYYAPIYNTTGNTLTYNLTSTDNKRMVMRSDRLPTATNVQQNCCNGFALQHNESLLLYDIPDEGIVGINITTSAASTGGTGSGEDIKEENDNFTSSVIDSFSCQFSRPLECYGETGGNIIVNSGGCEEYLGERIFKGGCYIVVTTVFLSLIRDFGLMTEWISRSSINLGACRNVWSHIFANNWINGTLYAYAFHNDVTYGSPFGNQPNVPDSEFCTSTLVLHPTNNFYYRSSPYKDSNGAFIGKERQADGTFLGLFGPYEGDNFNYLLNPTTLMDLGPRNAFLQELVMSDEYDGYVANKLSTTTYGNVTEILNLLIISRLINQSFIQQMLQFLVGSNITAYFSRAKYKVDGDYSQLISINSELGVAPFESLNYPDNPLPDQSPVYFNGFSSSEAVIGIFFSSDTQTRDFITPKRTIVDDTVPLSSPCGFSYFGAFSQQVPFYQWRINDYQNVIFGNEDNGWNTDPIIGDSFLSIKYQSMDRTDEVTPPLPGSRYFKGTATNSSESKYYKGYIYAVNASGKIDESDSNWDRNNPFPESVTVGAPFYFYFGLKKGASAFDRFTTKWIDTTTFVD
jgi:hypothetical protein